MGSRFAGFSPILYFDRSRHILLNYMKHLMIHLAYKARVGASVQYRWIYPFERYMHNLKKKIKKNIRVEGFIVEAYIIEEISNFSLHLNPSMQTKLTQVG